VDNAVQNILVGIESAVLKERFLFNAVTYNFCRGQGFMFQGIIKSQYSHQYILVTSMFFVTCTGRVAAVT